MSGTYSKEPTLEEDVLTLEKLEECHQKLKDLQLPQVWVSPSDWERLIKVDRFILGSSYIALHPCLPPGVIWELNAQN